MTTHNFGIVVDINSDVGESFGAFLIGADDEVMRWVTSVNVAAGFHGGDPRTIDRVIRSAAAAGIGIGAHPGFPDLVGFGRRDMRLSADEIRTDVLYQIGAVHAFAQAAGVTLQHVKPHGQLNNMAVQDAGMASAVAEATASFDEELILISAGGELTVAGERAGLKVGHEVYADRAYTAAGTLVPRSQPGALIHDPTAAADRAVAMVRDGSVTAITGESLSVKVDTICLHADTGGASEIAPRLRQALESAGISVRPLAEILPASLGG